MLDKKLQLKDGHTIALIGDPVQLPLEAHPAGLETADAVLVFAVNHEKLQENLAALQSAARQGKLTWVAYPKAKQLDTDLDRDIIRDMVNQNGLDPVRQIALDDIWSALRLKAL
ncbi:MAG TPA: hypothetical protein VGD55_10210 [Acidothermaceae bacterium]